MSLTVYNSIPLMLDDSKQEHHFILKVNPSTDSFRLEGEGLKRNISIGRRVYNKLFQVIRNEYGLTLGRIVYENEQMNKGQASTEENNQFQFIINVGNNAEVVITDLGKPEIKLKASVELNNVSEKERISYLHALMPSVLAALIFTKEFYKSIATIVS
jgi:hypothetical protein